MATAEADARPAGYVRWRRRLLILVLAVLGVITAVHVFGGAHVGMSAAAIGGLALLGFVIWRLPHLRRHFAKPGGSLNYPGQRGMPKPFRRSGGGARFSPGSVVRRHRPRASAPGRGGAGSGRSLRRSGPGGSRRSRAFAARGPGTGRGAGRGPGRGRPGTRGLSRSRNRAGAAGGGRRRSGSAAGRRGGPGIRTPFRGRVRSRAGTGSSRRVARRPAGGTGARRRLLPVSRRTGTARRAAGTRPGTAGRGTGTRRRRVLPGRRTRPASTTRPGGKSTRPAAAPPVVPVTRPSRWHPVARARWRRARSGKVTPAWRRKARHRLNRVSYRARRGWNIMRGRPGGQLSRKPGMNPVRRRWRVRRGKTVPGGWTPGEQQRYRRRSARRRLPRRQRIRLRLGALMSWRRHRPPPKPLARGGRHRAGRRLLNGMLARIDRRRMSRWVRARRRGRPPVIPSAPRPARTVPSQQPKPGPPLSPSPNGHRTSPSARGGAVDVTGMADEIRSMGGEFSDPDDVHNYLVNVHDLIAALQENLVRSGEQLSEMGVHPRYPEAIHEAGAALSGIAEEVEAIVSGGVMRGPGG